MVKKHLELDCSNCGSRHGSVFCTLEHESLTSLNREKNSNLYKKGQNLFVEGNPPFGLYCVNSGKVKITKTGVNGKETIIRIAQPGDLLGHRSMFSQSPYTASATAIEEAKVCFISKETINKLITQNPLLCFEIINRLSQQMGAAEERLTSLSQKSVRERFAELLLLLNESYGELEEKRSRLNIKLTREEMASLVGTASENLIRLITEFKKDGLIEQEGKTLFLCNLPKIEEYASLEC